jgi:hypothetical protein
VYHSAISNNVKRVVIVAPDFVPSNMPPALRARLFARHLPSFGWEPIVLAADPRFYEGRLDWENQRLLPDTLRVIRTPALPVGLARKLGIGDIGMRSFWHIWRALRNLCASEQVDLVLIPVAPYVPMLLGRMAHARFGVPYVIDYSDPWITETYWRLPRSQRPPKWALAYALSRLIEPLAVGRVSAIAGVSEGTLDSVSAYHPALASVPSAEIPFGGEPEDFAWLREHPRKHDVFKPNDGCFHLSYVGVCIPQMHAVVRALFTAVRQGLDSNPARFSRLRLHFVGTNYSPRAGVRGALATLAEEAGIGDLVEERTARLPYLEALQVMLDSHALVAIGTDEPHYTASKIFPCILARKPLLAIFREESTILDILRRVQTGQVVSFGNGGLSPDAVARITAVLQTMLQGTPVSPYSEEAFLPFTARAITGRLAALFDSILPPALELMETPDPGRYGRKLA